MSDIKFNCPQCGQHLAVDAAGAGTTVACPKCGQSIIVPRLARLAKSNSPKRMKWWLVSAGVAAAAVLAAGFLIWQTLWRPTVQTKAAPIPMSAASKSRQPVNISPPTKTSAGTASLTSQMLQGKQFRFSWKTEQDSGNHGILSFHNDGTLSGGTGSPNETFWSIDEKERLIFKHQDGRISSIFTHAEQRDGKWLFSGPYQFQQGIEHLLEEVSPETIAKEKWSKALNDAVRDFQNNNDQESANFASGILASLDQPGGMSPAALAAAGQRMNDRVRELVHRGALESGASLNWAAWSVLFQSGYAPNGPPNPNHRTGGAPGPGGLVLYLPFDKPDKDGVIHDESGAGNDGHVFGAQWVPDGKFGGAYHFSLTNLTDRIVIPNSDTLNPDYITVAAWIKAADKDGFWNRILDKDWRNGFCLSLGGDYKGKAHRGKLVFESSAGQVETGPAFDDNRWHHVAITFDGKMISAFIDGVGQSHPVRSPGPLKRSAWDLCIGNSVVDYGTGEFIAFDGLIDEVRIYNRALSADEIKLLATATRTGANILPLPADAAGKPDAATRLKTLKSLYDQGLINKDDYDKKVKEIMDSL
jgi:DNA-directed RNA polymerase subunit RPC12/RpoP